VNKGFDNDQENTTRDLIQLAEPIRTSVKVKIRRLFGFLIVWLILLLLMRVTFHVKATVTLGTQNLSTIAETHGGGQSEVRALGTYSER